MNEPIHFSVTLTDNTGQWFTHQLTRINRALHSMGKTIKNESLMKAPKKDGPMRESAQVIDGNKAVIVIYGGGEIQYAGYQERGKRRDGSYAVKRYTTPGTSAHFLENTGKNVTKRGLRWLLSRS